MAVVSSVGLAYPSRLLITHRIFVLEVERLPECLTEHVPCACPASQHVMPCACLTWSLTQADGIRPQQGPSTPCLWEAGSAKSKPACPVPPPAEISKGRITCLPTCPAPEDDSPVPRHPSPMSVLYGACAVL